MVWTSRIIKGNLEKEVFMKYSMSDNFYDVAQPWLN